MRAVGRVAMGSGQSGGLEPHVRGDFLGSELAGGDKLLEDDQLGESEISKISPLEVARVLIRGLAASSELALAESTQLLTNGEDRSDVVWSNQTGSFHDGINAVCKLLDLSCVSATELAILMTVMHVLNVMMKLRHGLGELNIIGGNSQ